MEVETTKMNNIADPQQRQWTTRPFPNSTAMFQQLAELYPPQQWMWVLLPTPTAIMQQITHLYPQMHAPPWYPLQGNPPAGYTWGEVIRISLVEFYFHKGYPNDVYPPPQPQLNELHFFGALVVNYPPTGYANDVYPPPQQVDSPSVGYPTSMGYPNDVYPPPKQVDSPPAGYPSPVGYPNDVYPPPQQVDSPPKAYLTLVGYPNNVYPPPP
ncbi:hypothetical protein CKAN_01910500 [Cinnamomum micranthum f. kanehirae]|uniref:Uncharacterized protein n=1 Tax=Cinnamomum micranthum f. kanehirae TaxID=337451 RepID=A0A3S3QSZ0_9MAGN|nr:hypothetical protein CKAN_01910500 [Cinnamomum micranthum f. kanehirae]